jgi:lactaldehyde reductase
MDKMALGQYIAGMGFSNVGLGIVHSMSHQLGAMYDTPHGVANAILLPYVMKYNGEVCADRFVDMAKEMDLEVNKTNAVATVVEAIKELNSRLDIPEHIKEVGVLEKDIPLLAEKALNDPCTGGNPREMDIKEFEDLFKEAL